MGVLMSKEDSVQLKWAVGEIQNCLKIHESNVTSIESAVNAQSESVQILSTIMLDNKGAGDAESEHSTKRPLEMTQSLLSHIQGTLLHQVRALDKSFKLLDDCIQQLSANYSQEHGPSADTDRRGEGRSKTRTQKDRHDTVSLESEKISDETSKSGAPLRRGGDMDNSFKAENKLFFSDKQELQKKLSEQEDLTKAFQDESNRQAQEIKELKISIRHKEEEISRLQKNKDEKKKECDRLDLENKHLNSEMSKHRKNAEHMQSLESSLRRTNESNSHLQNTVDNLSRKINALEEERRKIKERKMLVPVQLYFQRRDELMTLVVNELSAMLDTQFQTKNLQLEIKRCENSASIQPDKPVLVLCINSSRLGTDASAAIEGVQRSGRTALLIFHHKNIHALPNQSSDRMLTSSEFKQLGGIFDLAFLSGKGIYPCDMNNQALACIDSFIQRNIPGK